MNSNQYYKNEALSALKSRWTPAVLATVIFFVVAAVVMSPGMIQSVRLQNAMTSVASADPATVLATAGKTSGTSALTLLLEFFVLMPLSVGFVNALRVLLERGDDRVTANSFSIATSNYLHKVWGMFLMTLFITLWSFLLIIPGIIKAYSYAMTPYILEEHPELSANDAIDRSRAMMKGHKFDLFYLQLSFIGWILLAALTFGIGYFWLAPYMDTAQAAFYRDLKNEFGDGFDAVVKQAEVL